jgi:SAM-dependent methyltransferase
MESMGLLPYIITIGLSAFLLFLIQPMISKIILPVFGGGASIWLTSLIFFQVLLLAGYFFSHILATYLSPKKKGALLFIVTGAAFLFIPLNITFPQVSLFPTVNIFIVLFTSIGLPYFLLSSTSPILQHFIAVDPHNKERNPYVQYAVSNTGSLGGLLVYPVLIEPLLTNSMQTKVWSYGFCIYSALIAICIIKYLKGISGRSTDNVIQPGAAGEEAQTDISLRTRADWLVQSMIPSATLIVITRHLTTDIVNLPLLWILPLCCYLASFIICFLFTGISRPSPLRTLAVILPVAAMGITLRSEIDMAFWGEVAVACGCLFAICMFFHGNLERGKPHSLNLTSFYFYLSAGACFGSILAGILAPQLFKSNFELYIVIIVTLYFLLAPSVQQKEKKYRLFYNIVAAVVLAVVFISQEIISESSTLFQTRNFYGSYTILEKPEIKKKQIAGKLLLSGTTVHGGEARQAGRLIPITYYHEKSGVGLAFSRIKTLKNIGCVGLGTGVVALYGKKGQVFDFYEIDPDIIKIAQTHFNNLKTSRAAVRNFAGDARVKLRKVTNGTYDMLVVDAFTGGAIPTHLLTHEAMEEFFRVLSKDGLILFHISNQFVNLLPVLSCNAEKMGLHIMHHESVPELLTYRFYAHWVAVAKNRKAFDLLTRDDKMWKEPAGSKICWTDEFSNIWSVINFRH